MATYSVMKYLRYCAGAPGEPNAVSVFRVRRGLSEPEALKLVHRLCCDPRTYINYGIRKEE